GGGRPAAGAGGAGRQPRGAPANPRPLPGFRRGKVPPPLVIQRVGRQAVLDEAVREPLQGWYGEAIDAAGMEPIGDPEVDLAELPGEGQPLTFSVEIGVRPAAILGEYRGL